MVRGGKEPAMNDTERDQLLQRITVLERARGRWRLLALGLAALLVLCLLGGVGPGLTQAARARAEQARAEQARAEAERAAAERQRLQGQGDRQKAKPAERTP